MTDHQGTHAVDTKTTDEGPAVAMNECKYSSTRTNGHEGGREERGPWTAYPNLLTIHPEEVNCPMKYAQSRRLEDRQLSQL